MSAHYSTREPSGCCGCVAALALAVGLFGATAYACWMFAAWLAWEVLRYEPLLTGRLFASRQGNLSFAYCNYMVYHV